MIFWWTGKGWKAAAIPLGLLAVFGVLERAISAGGDGRLWYWGIALLASAGLVWHFGSADNATAIGRKAASSVWQRLFYKPRNRFMSLPTETWALPLAIAGVGLIGRGFSIW